MTARDFLATQRKARPMRVTAEEQARLARKGPWLSKRQLAFLDWLAQQRGPIARGCEGRARGSHSLRPGHRRRTTAASRSSGQDPPPPGDPSDSPAAARERVAA